MFVPLWVLIPAGLLALAMLYFIVAGLYIAWPR